MIACALLRGRRGADGKLKRVTLYYKGRSKHFTPKVKAFAVT